MKYHFLSSLVVLCLSTNIRLNAQSVELYAGDKRAGVDLMWFKNFKNSRDQRTPLLFFSRNRASTDYKNSPTAFGSTNAISYNFKNGIGIVGVGAFLNAGFTPKVGVQYSKQKGDFMFFGWFVSDLKKNNNLDLFGLFRYQPKFNNQWRGFIQAELFPVYNPKNQIWNFTERFRLGARYHTWASGLMLDFNQAEKNTFTSTNNLGIFIRNEF